MHIYTHFQFTCTYQKSSFVDLYIYMYAACTTIEAGLLKELLLSVCGFD